MTGPSPDTRPGVSAATVTTARLRTRVLSAASPVDSADPPADPLAADRLAGRRAVLFLHGNLSSATWWEDVLLTLPAGFYGIAPDQRGFGGADPRALIDATRGLGDLADDAIALLDHLGVERAHLVGHSMGGSVAWRLLVDHPARWLGITLVAPGSPHGFGGSKDLAGTPCHGDWAGSGAGLIRPELVARLRAGDHSADSPMSPRMALRALVYRPPFVPTREDALVAATLSTHLGERAYPGDSQPSPNWPFVAPGRWGINNALSPRHAAIPAERLAAVEPKPDILWVRGDCDLAVADRASADPGTWGPIGLVPGYPGADVYPPQPMLGQTRAALDAYRAAGGRVVEELLRDVGHAPYIEDLPAFNRCFHRHLGAT